MIAKPSWTRRFHRSLVFLGVIAVLVGAATLVPPKAEGQTTALDLARQGVRAYRLEYYKLAETRFREALSRRSNLLLAMTGLGWTLYDTHRYDEALPVFARAHRTYPNDGSSTRGLAYIHYRQGDRVKAQALLGSLDRDRWPELANIDLALAREKEQKEKRLQEQQAQTAARLASGDSRETAGTAITAAPKQPARPSTTPSRDAAVLTSKRETSKIEKPFQEGPTLSYHEEDISPSPASREEKSSPSKDKLSGDANRAARPSPEEAIMSRKKSEPVGTDKPFRPSAWENPIPLASAPTAKPKSQPQSNTQKAESKPSSVDKPAMKMTADAGKKAAPQKAAKMEPTVMVQKSPPAPKAQSAPAPSRTVLSSGSAPRSAQVPAASQKVVSPPAQAEQAKRRPVSSPVAQKPKPATELQAKKMAPTPPAAQKKQRVEVARASRPSEPKKTMAPRAQEDPRLEISRPTALRKPAEPKPVSTALKTPPAPRTKAETPPVPLKEKAPASIAKPVSKPSPKPSPTVMAQSRGSRLATSAPAGPVNARFVVPRATVVGPSQDYTIGGKDVLRVVVFEEPDLSSDNIRVSIKGYITYPLLGRVKVAGMTTSQVEQKLTYLLKKDYLVNPQVSVQLREYASKMVNVLGAVQNRGAIPLKGPATLLEVLTLAGGVSATDAGSTLTILRRDKKGVRNISINLERFLKGGDLSQNIPVQNGDTIFVPQADQIFVFGEVNNPGPYKLRSEKVSIVEALTMAGGPTRLAATNRSRVVRVENGKERVIRVNVESIISGSKKDDIHLKGGDIIVIPQTYF